MEPTENYSVDIKVKSHPEPFAAVWSGEKGHEIRFNDRDYQVSKVVRLIEYNPDLNQYMGRAIDLCITHLRHSPGPGYKGAYPRPDGAPISAGLIGGYVVFDFLIIRKFSKLVNPLEDLSDIFTPEGPK
jgi:hypothetical protein